MRYAIVTFGCRVNQADSLVIEDRLRAQGGDEAAPDQADLLVVNTCSVTASADQGARQTIRRIVRNNPAVQVIVTGCYATRHPEEVAALPNVVRVVSNAEKDDFDFTTAQRFGDGDGACGGSLAPGVAGRTTLTLRVQTGCEEQCSYCIIPRTRGASRSRPLRAVITDIERAVGAGYKEIAVTGVHLGSYGRDLEEPSSLTELVTELAAWDGDVLFRISSLEPMDCTREIVTMVASSPRLAPHFHLPLQHGSDEILRAMRRPYSGAFYADLVREIRTAMPQASIGSDIIVGFPGEGDGHFAEMRERLEHLPLSYLHVFPYSDRPGTEASAMTGKVDGPRIRERSRQIRDIASRMSRHFRISQSGLTRRALVVDDGMSAVTDNYLKVPLAERHARNEWVNAVVDNRRVS